VTPIWQAISFLEHPRASSTELNSTGVGAAVSTARGWLCFLEGVGGHGIQAVSLPCLSLTGLYPCLIVSGYTGDGDERNLHHIHTCLRARGLIVSHITMTRSDENVRACAGQVVGAHGSQTRGLPWSWPFTGWYLSYPVNTGPSIREIRTSQTHLAWVLSKSMDQY
jgi:hypothetical protein